MQNIKERAQEYLRSKIPGCSIYSVKSTISYCTNNETAKEVFPIIAYNPKSGVKTKLLVIPQLGKDVPLDDIIKFNSSFFEEKVMFQFGLGQQNKSSPIDSSQMIYAPMQIIYTDSLSIERNEVIQKFENANIKFELITEKEMFDTIFISYGSTDIKIAEAINTYLKEKGLKTWFFPDNALPGQKLHRVMFEEINNHDRVLLLCSENALKRSGVLNEIERVLEKEAKHGGSEIIIPITLDKFIYDEWEPDKMDIANQIKTRVISEIPKEINSPEFKDALSKVVNALKK